MGVFEMSADAHNFTGLLMCHTWLSNYNWNNQTDIYDINDIVKLENIGGIVLLSIVMAFGTVGNVPVLYIYGRKFRKSAYRFHILLLASTNYVTSCVLIPGNILFLSNPLLEFSNAICKAGVALIPFFAILAGYVLFMIGVDRYLATCRPEGQQITSKARTILLCCGITLAVLLSWPMLFLYGNHTVDTGINNIVATRCFVVLEYTRYLAILNGIWTTFSAINTVILVTLYTLIIRKIMQSKKQFKAIESDRKSTVLNKAIRTRKTTVTLFTVTAVSVVCNIPSNAIAIVVNSSDHYDCGLSLAASIVLGTIRWVRLVSPAINPFLYGFSDHRFRRELRNLFRRKFYRKPIISVSSASNLTM